MYELRKQSAHVFFVIGAIEKVFKNGNFENRFIVDLDEIVKNAKIKSAVKDEINNMKEKKVDLIDLVISFKKVFLDLISNIFIDKRKEIEDS